jgi:predicted unusual protein kinase regulating ubiquinone biosynthesis (AarF/ABC1/UbiB family)
MENEIELVVKKINKIFVEHGWILPKQRLQIFIDSLEKILTECHDKRPAAVQLKEIKKLRN